MRKFLAILFLMVVGINFLSAQTLDISPELKSPLRKVYEGKYHFVEEETGDTLLMLVFYPITAFPQEKFKTARKNNIIGKPCVM